MNQKEKLSAAIKTEREKLGLTQMQLANKIGVALSTIADIENCKANPRFDTLCQIFSSLHLPLADIFTETEPSILTTLNHDLNRYSAEDLDKTCEILDALLKSARKSKDAAKKT